ncbi:MAG: hypothetical protein B6D59_05585 [Campylobacteraceae bacterium 4484_4]|nr:MAG: hypothetical protein B6D59_05585 [Campylobacteraceae bacterium 4484_4]
MTFLSPEYLLFMFIPLIALFYLIVTGKSIVASLFDEKMLEKLTFDNDTLGRTGRNIMLFVALMSMIVALARPVLPKSEITLKSPSRDLIIALDISRSMLANDLFPDRLTFAKMQIAKTIDALKEANIGLLAFSDAGFLVSPMTRDSATLIYLLENLSVESVTTQGTNFLLPIEKAAEMLKKSRPKVLILFTDGGDQRDFSKEIALAKKAGLKIHIYALGTQKGAPIPSMGTLLKDKKGDIVIVRRNDVIATLAQQSGGGYFIWDSSGKSLQRLIDTLQTERARFKERKIKTYRELFYYPLMLALLFMLFAFSSLPKKTPVALWLIALLSLPAPSPASMLDFRVIQKAQKAYQNGEYAKAAALYEKLVRSKQNAATFYALGNAYYKSGKYQKALVSYGHVITKDPELEYKKEFNMGNCYFQMQKYRKALELYLQAQKIHDSEDLRYNIELTKKRLRQQQKKRNRSGQKEPKKAQNKKSQKRSNSAQKSQKPASKGEKAPQKPQPSHTRKLSEEEIKAWERRLKRQRPKTRPLKFQTISSKRVHNEKPW